MQTRSPSTPETNGRRRWISVGMILAILAAIIIILVAMHGGGGGGGGGGGY